MSNHRASRLILKKNRIRAFFASLEKKAEKKIKYESIEEQILREGMVYRQMRLPVEKITPEFEEKLRKKVEENFLRAKVRRVERESKHDLRSVMDIYNKAWLTASTPFRPLTLEALKKIYSDPDTVILIARVYNMDVGFVILDFEGENKEIGVIAGLGVLPRFQRKGLGTVIGMAAWNFFKEKGVKELRCEVYKDNVVSYSFIKKIGFEEFGVKAYKPEDFEIEERT
ncbi:MAG: GNAT family N-acetyltransferase [Promethearchaeota archaeon]